LSDDGGTFFRRVTRDHRVVNDAEDDEVVRLRAAKAVLKNQRIYPGGLSVSRSIGDVAYSSAVISTPDVFAIDLMPTQSDDTTGAKEQTHRFILATDGLWDSLGMIVKRTATKRSVEALVGELAARSNATDPKAAAINLMKRSLQDVGCVDDVTIVVVDVTVHV
jgi:serine/threonine protein phosphatase PrpC